MVALAVDKQAMDNKRLLLLHEFGKEVSLIPTKELTREAVIDKARQRITEAMYSKSMYVALYEREQDEIYFPYAIKDGELWKEIHGERRPMIRERLGKTEKIILTGDSIIHYTKQEARAWYDNPEHQDYANDSLASWIGVPVFGPEGVIGAIAAFHPTEEFVYLQRDLFFLQMMSQHVSGLFRALALKETNQKLEEANQNSEEMNKLIAEYESQLRSTLLAQDITHRLKGSLGSMSISITSSIEDLDNITDEKEIVRKVVGNLKQVKEISGKLLRSIKEITSVYPENIKIYPLIEEVVKQVSIEYRVMNIKIKSKYKNIISKQNQRSFYHVIYSLLSNSCDAVISTENPIIDVYIKEDSDFFEIIIKDNGVAVDKETEEKMFGLGFTTKSNGQGYALWRGRNFARSQHGDLIFYREGSFKCFNLRLPIVRQKLLAYVIDDEKIWVDIISKWLEEMGYSVKTASNANDANKLFDNLKEDEKPRLVLLDVSLSYTYGNNVEGLSLIPEIKNIAPNAKIIVVTGFSGMTDEYSSMINLMLEKVDSEGNPLDKNTFKFAVEKLGGVK